MISPIKRSYSPIPTRSNLRILLTTGPPQPKTTKSMALCCCTAPNHPRCNHPFQTPCLLWKGLCHAPTLRTVDLPKVCLKGSGNALYGVYQDWVHQNPGNHLDGGIKEDGKWQDRWKNLSVYQPSATTHRLAQLVKRLSQSSQWSLAAYNLGSGTSSR